MADGGWARAAGFLVGLALLATGRRARAAVDYADAGAYTYGTSALDAGIPGAGGTLVVPNEPGPFPLLVASHGWSAGPSQQLGWAEHFATWGFIVAVPAFPNTLSPDANVDEGIIAQLVSLFSNPATESPAKGKVDPSRIGLEGHSAGGLATALAARSIGPAAVVFFDPVDSADAGRSAYADLCAPVLGIFAGPSSCNNQAEWSTFAADTIAPLVTFHVVGSTHCDGENQDRGVACGLVCGGNADPARQAVYARYATAFFLAHLRGDANAATMFAPASLTADPSVADASTQPGSGCSPDAAAPPGSSDAGASTPSGSDAAGTSQGDPPPTMNDGGSAVPGGAAGGATSAEGAGTSGSTSGCGCSLAGATGSGSVIALFVVGALALARRRRQARG